MKIEYFEPYKTTEVNGMKILLIAKIPINETDEPAIKAGLDFYKDFFNCDVALKNPQEPDKWYFGQEIKLANFTDIPCQKNLQVSLTSTNENITP
jgi:hypothetical protein